MGSKAIIPLGFVVGALLIGLILGVIINDVPYLTLDRQVGFGEIVNIVIALLTLSVAVYIANVLEPKKKKEEYVFDFLIQKFSDLQTLAKKLVTTVSGEPTEIYQINRRLKDISVSYIDLKDVFAISNTEVDTEIDKEILNLMRHLKRLCTEQSVYKYGTNIIAYTDQTELLILSDDNKLEYSQSRVESIKEYIGKIINQLFYLMLLK